MWRRAKMGAKKSNGSQQYDFQKVEGFVEEFEYDDGTTGLLVVTENDDEYIVEMNPKGQELYDYVGDLVEVTGEVALDRFGDFMINVESIEYLEYEENEDYDSPLFDPSDVDDDYLRE
jgi:hypothetical protein